MSAMRTYSVRVTCTCVIYGRAVPRRSAWRWSPILIALLVAKLALLVMLLLGTFVPDVGGFAGKGMGFRLPVFLAPALIIPVRWWFGRRWHTGLDVAFTVPFMLDIAGNAFGFYDRFDITDDVLHTLNWVVLIWGITTALRRPDNSARVLVWIAGTGIGALAIIGWEIAEYAVMQAGTVGLNLTYADTLGDLALSSSGGALGALIAVRMHRQLPDALPSADG
jgi:hypothetical protein